MTNTFLDIPILYELASSSFTALEFAILCEKYRLQCKKDLEKKRFFKNKIKYNYLNKMANEALSFINEHYNYYDTLNIIYKLFYIRIEFL